MLGLDRLEQRRRAPAVSDAGVGLPLLDERLDEVELGLTDFATVECGEGLSFADLGPESRGDGPDDAIDGRRKVCDALFVESDSTGPPDPFIGSSGLSGRSGPPASTREMRTGHAAAMWSSAPHTKHVRGPPLPPLLFPLPPLFFFRVIFLTME